MKANLIITIIVFLLCGCNSYNREIVGKWEFVPQEDVHGSGSETLEMRDNMTYHNRFRLLFDVTQSSECEININTEGRWEQEGDSLFFNGHTIAESNFLGHHQEYGSRKRYKIESCSDRELVLSNDSAKNMKYVRIE
jgi:hypothetical protein